MQPRRVTAPDGTKWVVARRWLLRRPSYFGFRFGREEREPRFQPAWPSDSLVVRKPPPTKPPTPPPVRYHGRTRRSGSGARRDGSGGGSGFWSGWHIGRGFGGGGGGRGGSGGSIGGGSRGSSGGGGRSSSSGGGRRGGGGGGGAAIGGALAALGKVIKWIAIAAAVILVALFVVFVLIPALVFAVEFVLFWVALGLSIAVKALTGRPWIVEVEEHGGYRIEAFRVKGWRESRRVRDALADAIRRGEPLVATGAEKVELEAAE